MLKSLSVLWLACASVPAFALQLSLPQLPAYVTQHHPGLATARLTVAEAQGRLTQAGRLENPEAGLSFQHDDRFREGTVAVSFDQKFPLTARLRLEKELSAKAVTAAELEVSDATRKLVAQAQSLAVKLLSLEKQRTLRQQQADLAQKLSTFAATRAAAGELSALDAAQAQVDAQRSLLDGRVLETERISLLGELKPLLGLTAGEELTLKGELPAPVLPGPSQAWQQRPDYRLARLKEEAAQIGIRHAQAGKWQDVNAGVFVEGERMEDAPDGLQRTPFFGLRVSVPLPLWNKNEGRIQEQTATAQRVVLETQALALTIQNEAAAARADMQAQLALASDTKDKLLPLVLEQTTRLEKAYEQGQTDLLTVLRAREQRLQLEAAVLNAQRDFHLARVRFEAAMGAAR